MKPIKSPRKRAERAREERNTEEYEERKKKKTISKIEISIHLSIITLNVNEIKAPIKRQSS